jgi:hypothetical protein
MLQQFDKIPESFIQEYRRTKKASHKAKPDQYPALLSSCAAEFSRLYSNPVFIIIDAYDELQNKEDERKERTEFMSHLSHITETDHSRIFITTRRYYSGELETDLKGIVVDVEADPNDIDKYLNERLSDPQINAPMRAAIKARIQEACRRW